MKGTASFSPHCKHNNSITVDDHIVGHGLWLPQPMRNTKELKHTTVQVATHKHIITLHRTHPNWQMLVSEVVVDIYIVYC